MSPNDSGQEEAQQERQTVRIERPDQDLAHRDPLYPAVRVSGGPPVLPPRRAERAWEEFRRWWQHPASIALVLVLIVVLVVLVVVLLRGPGTSDVAVQPTPTATRTVTVAPPATPTVTVTRTVGPTPEPSDTPRESAPSTTGPQPGDLPPVPPTSRVLQTGIHSFTPRGDLDLDTNDAYPFSGADLEVTDNGMFATNGAIFARPNVRRAPQPSDCSLPFDRWVQRIPVRALRTGDYYCVLTTDYRYGYVEIAEVRTNNARTVLDFLEIGFTVWEGEQD